MSPYKKSNWSLIDCLLYTHANVVHSYEYLFHSCRSLLFIGAQSRIRNKSSFVFILLPFLSSPPSPSSSPGNWYHEPISFFPLFLFHCYPSPSRAPLPFSTSRLLQYFGVQGSHMLNVFVLRFGFAPLRLWCACYVLVM